jgi:hypothetical protein
LITKIRVEGMLLPPCRCIDFKSFASADFATRAGEIRKARYAAFHVHHNKRLN